MEKLRELIQTKREYEELVNKRAELAKYRDEALCGVVGMYATKLSAFKRETEAYLKQVAVVLGNLCRVCGALSWQGGQLYFNGKLPSAKPFDKDNYQDVYAAAKNDILTGVKNISTGKNVAATAKSVAEAYQTIFLLRSSIAKLQRESIEGAKISNVKTLAAVNQRIAEIEREHSDLDGEIKAEIRARQKEAGGADDYSSVKKRLDEEAGGTRKYSHCFPVGYLCDEVQDDISTYAKNKYNIQLEQAAKTSVVLDIEKSSVFIDVDDTFAGNKIKYHSFLSRLLYGAMLEFEPGNLQFEFIEKDGASVLSAISDTLTKQVSTNSVFSKQTAASGSFNKEGEIREKLSKLMDERDDRNTQFLQKQCTNIRDFNEINRDNPKKYIVLVINGYPESFSGDGFRYLKNLITSGGETGIFTIVLGHNGDILTGYDRKERLDFEALGMREIRIGRGGDATYNGKPFDTDSLAADYNGTSMIEALNRRCKLKDLFSLDSIIEQRAKEPFYERISIPLGNADGLVYSHVTATEKPPYPFTLITGATGRGKSAFLHTFIMSAAMKYSPEELEFHIVDFKSRDGSIEFNSYIKKDGVRNLYIPHVKYLSLKSRPENALDILNYINDLMVSRNKLGMKRGEKFRDYNAKNAKKLPMIYVIIDEYNEMLQVGASDDNSSFDGAKYDSMLIQKKIRNRIKSILKRARIYGIGVIFSGQNVELPQDAMEQINNRIAFFNEGGFDRMFGKWNDRMADKFPQGSENIGYAYCADSGSAVPQFVKMAFGGTHDSEEMLNRAERIREKYKNSDCTQIIIGDTSRVVADSASVYRTWQEEIDYELNKYKAEFDEDADTFEAEKRLEKEKPLAIGIASAASQAVNMKFTLDVNGVNYFAHAGESKLLKIEQNAAFAFLFQTADIRYTKPRILYCDTAQSATYDVCFGKYVQAKRFLNDSMEHVFGEQDIARRILMLADEMKTRTTDAKPLLIIIHEAEWMRWNNKADWLPKHQEQKTSGTAEKTRDDTTKKYNDVSEKKMEQIKQGGLEDVLALVRNVNTDDLKKAVERLDNSGYEYFSQHQVKEAFAELYNRGNRKGIFLLVTSQVFSAINDVVFAVADSSGKKDAMHDHAVYGSFNEMISKKVETSFESENTCYVCPDMTTARLFDYNVNKAWKWWFALEKRLKNSK